MLSHEARADLARVPLEGFFEAQGQTLPVGLRVVETRQGPALDWEGGGGEIAEDKAILTRFIKLEKATPKAVLRFAQRHGTLLLCADHRLFLIHRSADPAQAHSTEPIRTCRMLKPEPLALWKDLARQVRATLQLASELYISAGALYRSNWRDAGLWRDMMGERFMAVPRDANTARMTVACEVHEGLEKYGGAALSYAWSPARLRPRIAINTPTMLARVYWALALSIAKVETIFFCDFCAEPYEPARYRPRPGERRICGKPKCQRAAKTEAQRERRNAARKPVLVLDEIMGPWTREEREAARKRREAG